MIAGVFPDFDQACERMVAASRLLIRNGRRAEAQDLLDGFLEAMDDADEPWMRTYLHDAERLVAEAGLA